ncbi:MAG: alpha/beta hydrolase [Thermoguttaceae bacterium]|nr:alpha/beta hydrolase [Thermoguttaceae bacterium]
MKSRFCRSCHFPAFRQLAVSFLFSAIFAAGFCFQASAALAQDLHLRLWPGLAPGETVSEEKIKATRNTTCPMIDVFLPEKEKACGKCLMIFPGGGYEFLSVYPGAFYHTAEFFRERGFVCCVLQYRVPVRKWEGKDRHHAAWQDAQRAIRLVRSKAREWGIDPEEIGAMGGSAGGHLTVVCAVNSQHRAYEPIDEIDEFPCHLNYAAPMYPAYIVPEEKYSVKSGSQSMELADNLYFDEKTPPFCIFHGDADTTCTPTGALALYRKLRTMNIPAELHIYAKTPHTFVVDYRSNHRGTWLQSLYDWFCLMDRNQKAE